MSDYSHGREKAKAKALRAGTPEYDRDLSDELARRNAKVREYDLDRADELHRAEGIPMPRPDTVKIQPMPEAPIRTLPTMTTVLQGAPASAGASLGGMPDHSPEALPALPSRPERPSPMPDVSALAQQVPQGAWVGDPRGRQAPQPSLQDLLQPNRDTLAAIGQ